MLLARVNHFHLLLLLHLTTPTSTTTTSAAPFTITHNGPAILPTLSGTTTTPVFRLPMSFDLNRLRADYISATKDWDWSKDCDSGHSRPLLSESQISNIIPFGFPFHTPAPRENFLQECCPYFTSIYDYFKGKTQVVAMRLLQRRPLTAYVMHSDDDLNSAAENVRRFQIPIHGEQLSGLLLTLAHNSMLPVIAQRGENYQNDNPLLGTVHHYPPDGMHKVLQWWRKNNHTNSTNARSSSTSTTVRGGGDHGYTHELMALAKHVTDFSELGAVYRLTPGYLHHFDTRTKHTIVNLSPFNRVTLAIDVIMNDELARSGMAMHDDASMLKERQRRDNVMLDAARTLRRKFGRVGTIKIDSPRSGVVVGEEIDVDMSVSFKSTVEYDTYKVWCGKTVQASALQLAQGDCRVVLYVGEQLVEERKTVETIKMDLRRIVDGTVLRLKVKIFCSDGVLLMESDQLVLHVHSRQ